MKFYVRLISVLLPASVLSTLTGCKLFTTDRISTERLAEYADDNHAIELDYWDEYDYYRANSGTPEEVVISAEGRDIKGMVDDSSIKYFLSLFDLNYKKSMNKAAVYVAGDWDDDWLLAVTFISFDTDKKAKRCIDDILERWDEIKGSELQRELGDFTFEEARRPDWDMDCFFVKTSDNEECTTYIAGYLQGSILLLLTYIDWYYTNWNSEDIPEGTDALDKLCKELDIRNPAKVF